MVVVVHHAIADGLGLVTLFRDLLTPPAGPLPTQRPAPGRLARAVTTAAGLMFLASRAGLMFLASRAVAPAPRPFPTPSAARGPQRRYQAHTWPLPLVRAAARQMNLRVTDLLLAAVGEAVRACLDAQGRLPQNTTLRTAVPRTLRAPSPAGYLGPPGNLTAGLLIDVPLGRMTVRERARRVGEQTGPHATAQALAGAAVLRAAGSLPAAAHRRTVQQMYRSPHFDAIVTNMPGPAEPLRLLGLPLCTVHPVVPLADGVPLAVGAMGWNDHYCLSFTVDATRLDPAVVSETLRRAIDDLVGRPAQRTRWTGTQHTLDAYQAPPRPAAATDLNAGPATTPDGTA
ncbi:WS/DGAT domain-containing protein [Parafrankia sp. FMc2]|uniref:WS/DGAT domain-containing protein n=1 Tax=Parafrankia sp. FMc2 TaxID=3233196 RepID=UPI0034D3F9E0